MLKHIKNWLLNKALFIALLISAIIALLSLLNTKNLPTSAIGVSDKVMHATAYLILIWSWMLVFVKHTSARKAVVLFFVLLFYGIILEFIQGELTQYRTADWKDIIANGTGLLLGLISFKNLYRFVFT